MAWGAVGQLGVRGATLEDIAIDVGMNLTSIRHYFRKKDDLVAAGFLRSIDVHMARTELSKSAGSREARVRDFVRRYFEFRRRVRAGEEMDVMSFGDLRALAEPHASQVWPRYVDLFRSVREIVADPEEREQDRHRVNARAHLLISQLIRSVYWLPEYPDSELDRVEARFTDVLLNGIAQPGTSLHGMVELSEKAPPDKRSWESFLLAATRLINQQGYRGASVERIARQMNVTKGSFYHHNDNKQDLISACFDRTFGVVRRALVLAEEATGSGWDRACAAARVLVRYQLSEHGPLLRSSATSALPDEAHRERVRRTMIQMTERMVCVLVDGMMDRSIRPVDPSITAQIAIGLINAAAELRRWVPGATRDNAVDLYARPMFLGLLCPPA